MEKILKRAKIAAVLSAVIIGLVVSYGCNLIKGEKGGGQISIYVEDTFSGEALSSIPVTIECSDGERVEGVTSEGQVNFEIEQAAECKIMVNISNASGSANSQYIPSIFERVQLSGGQQLRIDIVKEVDLNPEGIDWRGILQTYRGSDNANKGFVNQRWNSQPERWIVYDPHGCLKKYADPKDNPVFNSIMTAFNAIEEYTSGFIKAPSKDEVEIVYKRETLPFWAIGFVITEHESWAMDDEDSSGVVIIRSAAGAGYGSSFSVYNMISEAVSSVQGGDNEYHYPVSDHFDSVFFGDVVGIENNKVKLLERDRKWGMFNYRKRKPGDKMPYPCPYNGRLCEIRKLNQ